MPEFDAGDPIQWAGRFWSKQRLGDPTKFMAFGSLLRVHQLVTDELGRVLNGFDLSLTGYLLLATVQLSPTGARLISQIATHMMVHPTTVTLTVAKLEAQGWLERQAHPNDRRATYVAITPAGTAQMRSVSRALDKIGYGMFGLTKDQASDLLDFLTPIRRMAGDSTQMS